MTDRADYVVAVLLDGEVEANALIATGAADLPCPSQDLTGAWIDLEEMGGWQMSVPF